MKKTSHHRISGASAIAACLCLASCGTGFGGLDAFSQNQSGLGLMTAITEIAAGTADNTSTQGSSTQLLRPSGNHGYVNNGGSTTIIVPVGEQAPLPPHKGHPHPDHHHHHHAPLPEHHHHAPLPEHHHHAPLPKKHTPHTAPPPQAPRPKAAPHPEHRPNHRPSPSAGTPDKKPAENKHNDTKRRH